MKTIFLFLFLLLPQVSLGEIVFFDIVSINGMTVVSRSDTYWLTEEATVEDRIGHSVSLREIKLPARVKGDAVQSGEKKLLHSVILLDKKNNMQIPE